MTDPKAPPPSPTNQNDIEIIPEPEPDNSLFNTCKNQLKELIKDLNINTSTLHLIIKYTMELVEKHTIQRTRTKRFCMSSFKRNISRSNRWRRRKNSTSFSRQWYFRKHDRFNSRGNSRKN